ncbi:Capsular associated protein [Pseudozyma hubeiensis]|nr:Capsular associated protein [Pseudozyma hubeiensis]
MHRYQDNTVGLVESEKESLSATASTSSYPPSPSHIEHEPAWARTSVGGTTMRQRVSDLFSSKSSQGYVRASTTPSDEFGGHDNPLYASAGGSRFQEMMRDPSRKKLFRIICLILIIGVPYALFASTPSSAFTSAEAVKSMASEAGELSHQDRQCPRILAGAADAVLCHVQLAQRKFDAMVSRQSQTYDQAVERYVQQYNRQPPPGFDDWFKFAKDNNAVIIDDYGQLEKDLEPLRKIPGHVLRRRIENARKTDIINLHQWDFRNGNVISSAPEEWENVAVFRSIMSPFLHKLPDFTVLQSWDDAHRVCGPKDGVEDVNDTGAFKIGSTGLPDTREHLTRGCPRSTETTSSVASDRPSVDICTHSYDWMTKHGVFHTNLNCLNSSVPVLSLTKVSSFQDITTASWCYGSVHYRLFGDNKDTVPYSQKKTKIYWRGSSTGTRPEAKYAYFGHRQRLVMMAHQMKTKAAQLAARVQSSEALTFTDADEQRVELTNMPKTFTKTQLLALSKLNSDMFDMNFVGLHGCESDPKYCEEWKAKFPLAAHQPSSEAFQNKFLMDLDGNSMSCRFYRLLDSNSLVFKQTIYVEWHDDRIVPWLHYVPVSRGMEELPILLDFFANHPKGQELGEMIANASRDWAASALRKIDLSVYTYRQMLELANIIGHD